MIPHIFAYGMSRSGTTLLTTILDSHPDISMGYELMTKGIHDAGAASQDILSRRPEDARACSDELRTAGKEQLAVLVHRADRALVSPAELAQILRSFADEGVKDLDPFEGRIALARRITELKASKEGTSISGFKLNWPKIGIFDKQLGGRAAYVYILRDPRDIWRSHLENSFDRTVDQVAETWNGYLRRFEAFARRYPDRCYLVKYEDLVQKPADSLDALCAAIGIPRAATMDRFYESKASVLRGGHQNSDSLQRDFFTTSVGRWDDLPDSDLRALESACYDGMETHNYPRVTSAGFRFTGDQWSKHRTRLEKKRNYFVDEYGELMLPAIKAFPARTWHEATSVPADADREDVLLIRHDIDQDIENAVRLARWEAEHGIRATYCVLHTAWYYGRFDRWRLTARSEYMVEACLEIQSLGHEINLHNNAVVAGLRTGADPFDLLGEELAFLRGRGLDIRGTSTHGDRLCNKLGFLNLEVFSETVYPSRGGARTLEFEGNRVTIGSRSMRELDLDYEGYDLPRDVYISDSGGNLRAVTNTQGRAGQHRNEMSPPPPFRRIAGVLTHPVWWNLEQNAPEPRPELGFKALLKSVGQRPPRRALLPWGRRMHG